MTLLQSTLCFGGEEREGERGNGEGVHGGGRGGEGMRRCPSAVAHIQEQKREREEIWREQPWGRRRRRWSASAALVLA
jgi:hypothetical protein